MHTQAEIRADLERLGVRRDSIVLVHTSLKAVGETEGRGEGFLDALIEYFSGGGLLLIPTHTWKNMSDRSKPTLDMTPVGAADVKACIGTLPSLAAIHPIAHRSPHPTHSMAAFDGTPSGTPGRAEDYISCETNRKTPLTSTSPDGCYGRLYDLGGKVLLIGVGHNRDTYLHSVEERLDVPNRLSEKPVPATVKLASGLIIDRPLRCHCAKGIPDVSANYPKYEPAFRHYGAIADGKIGDAPSQLCDARIMSDVVKLVRERSGGIELLSDSSPLDEALYL